MLAVAKGIRSADPHALQTVELNYLTSTSLDDPRWRGIIGLDAAYTYAPTYAEVLKEYRRSRPSPGVHGRGELRGRARRYTGHAATLRCQEYWTMLSGATGQFYGNKYTWQFSPRWPHYLDTIGSRQMTIVTNLFSHRRWFDLVPDSNHRLVVSGYGTYSSSGDANGNDYVAAARTPDGSLAIAYLPTGQPDRRRHDEDGRPSRAGAMVRSDERKVRDDPGLTVRAQGPAYVHGTRQEPRRGSGLGARADCDLAPSRQQARPPTVGPMSVRSETLVSDTWRTPYARTRHRPQRLYRLRDDPPARAGRP